MNELTLKASIETNSDSLTVRMVCVERPDLPTRFGIGLKSTHRALAERLVRAIDAGVAIKNVQIKTDIHGAEYIASTCMILCRKMNAELRRLGF